MPGKESSQMARLSLVLTKNFQRRSRKCQRSHRIARLRVVSRAVPIRPKIRTGGFRERSANASREFRSQKTVVANPRERSAMARAEAKRRLNIARALGPNSRAQGRRDQGRGDG